jgi:hypothetical protein
MGILEKVVWALTGLTVTALILLMVLWKPSPIPTGAISVEEDTAAMESKSGGLDFSAGEKGSGSGGSRTGSRRTGGSRQASKKTKPKTPFPVKAKNYKYKPYKVNREFREKYGNSYRDVWDAMQKAEAQFITKPDGRKIVKIISIEKGSVIEKLQFRVGDEISHVNGRDFSEFDESSVSELYKRGNEVYDQLKSETEFQIELERGGVPTVMRFTVPK